MIAVTLLVRGLSRPIARPKQSYKGLKVSNGTNEFRSTVLIISLDGFRPDYIDRDVTPNMHALREKGVAPEFMRPSFPSVTFPNVTSIFRSKLTVALYFGYWLVS